MKITKKVYLVLFLVTINCSLFFSQDDSSDYKSDLAVGGGITPIFYQLKFNSAWALIESYNIDSNTGQEIFKSETEKLTGTPPEVFNFGGGLNLNFSYSYYYKTNSSIGVTCSLGYLFTPYYPKERTILMINNIITSRILLLKKIGKPTNIAQFFFEIGMILNLEIPYYPNGKSVKIEHKENKNWLSKEKILYKYELHYPDIMLGMGPNFDIGVELNIKNFSLVLCMFTWMTFGTVFDDAYQNLADEPLYENPRYNIVFVPIGFEVRVQFYNKYK